MDRVKAQVDDVVDYMISSDGKLEMTSEESYSPYNPVSIPLLEIVNTTGKDGVGIFATGLKGYAAMFTAYTNGIEKNSKFIGFKNEAVDMFNGNKATLAMYEDLYGPQTKALRLYNSEESLTKRYNKMKDSKVKGLPSLEKYIEKNRKKESTTLANTKKYYKNAVVSAKESHEDALSPQAWEDLSE